MPRKQNNRPKPRRGELPDEFRARQLRAKLEVAYLRSVEKQIKSLSTYGAADRGRRNKDWRAGLGSADLAIIPDLPVINARARQMVRDSWIGASIIRSMKRNGVGRGIVPAPVAKSAGGTDTAGTELANLNRVAERLFWEWASNPSLCDVEARQTFWQKQAMCVGERYTVGEHFIVWSYGGPGETNVGLKLQSFEPEQLDQTKFSADNGNEIRGGIEVDAKGAAVAYHFYERTPNDYYGRFPSNFKSRRIEKKYVFHYMRQDRTLQTHGVSELTPTLQRMRDFHRRDEAEMFAAIMEANIGLIIQKNIPTPAGTAPGFPRQSGDTGQTASGMRTWDLAPGSIFEAMPGEDVKPFAPQRPGNTYEPFARMQLRGISAGVGLSYDQTTRDFDQGTWHSKRQGTLEDQREWKIEQDLLIDTIILPIYELWFSFGVAEGWLPLSLDKYLSDPKRYSEAEYVGDAWQWTSPVDEVTAFEKAVKNRFITRKEIIAGRGGRYRGTMEQIASERDFADTLDITFPEDAEDETTAATPTGPDPALEQLKGEADAYGVAVRAGVITPQTDDEDAFRRKMGLPPMSAEAKAAWQKDEGTRRPITIQPSPGEPQSSFSPGGAVPKDDGEPPPSNGNGRFAHSH